MRQEQVLSATAFAINDVITASPQDPSEPSTTSSAIAQVGAEVVMCAMNKVAADITASGMADINPAMDGVPVQDVSSTTKSAVAQAVQQTGTTASPIEVLHTAGDIIQQETHQPSIPVSMPVSVGQTALMADMAAYSRAMVGDIDMQTHMSVVSNSLAGAVYQMEMSDYPMADMVPP